MFNALLESFFILGDVGSINLVSGTYQPWLVGLSLGVAVLSSGLALHLASLASRSTSTPLKWLILGTGAVAFGVGIWSMHFIGMLAFELCTHVSYDLGLSAASLMPGLVASFLAMNLLARPHLNGRQLALGGLIVGAGIGLMHYSGMAAMRMSLDLRYDPLWFAVSIFVAVVLAIASLWIRTQLKQSWQLSQITALVLSSVVMGLAIAGMHFTAMKAARFVGEADATYSVDTSTMYMLSISVAFATVLISALTVTVNLFLRYRFLYNEREFARVALQRSIREFENIVSANQRALNIIEFDLDRRIVNVNDNFLTLTGYGRDDLIGQHHKILCLPEEVCDPEYNLHWEALARGEFRSGDYRRIAKDGSDLWIHGTYNPILGDDGKPVRIMKFASDMTERHLMEKDLRQAKERAEQAAKSKTAFLANMSHEIRTPMNAIIGFTEVLLESSLDHRQRQHLDTVAKSAKSLLALLNDILDTAKLENGSMQLEVNDFSLNQLCVDVLATMSLSASSKGLAVGLDYEEGLGHFFKGDALRIQQVLLNLVGNAIKFTAKGRVDISVKSVAKGVRIEVTDTGIGIAEDRLHKIFEAFAQADASTTRRYGGTGLGTTIARQVTRLMGGEIGVTSQLGVGSCFFVDLPLRPGQAPLVEDTAIDIQLPALRILVVDDVAQNGELLQLRLGKLGHTVTTAMNGEEALAAVHAKTFDLVLMDMQMPVMDGATATRHIRDREQRFKLPSLPIIALTAGVLDEDRFGAVEAGMNGFASKPVDLRKLLVEISRVLGVEAARAIEAPATTTARDDDGVDWTFGANLWGSEEMLRARIEHFTRETLPQISTIQADDDSAQRAAAHRIKGAAGNLALKRIAEMADRLEDPGLPASDASELWTRVSTELQQLQARFASEPAATEATKGEPRGLGPHELNELLAGLARGELPEQKLETFYASISLSDRQILRQYVDNFEFDKAVEFVSSIQRTAA